MQQFVVKPEIRKYNIVKEFAEDFRPGPDDLIITNRFLYEPFFQPLHLESTVIFQEEYGTGEPSDEMVEKICRAVGTGNYNRVFGIGGGTVLDISKLFALKNQSPVLDLYDRKLPVEKAHTLILLPTTCGTGSEVTNISILELKSRHTKMGLAVEELYADTAVLIPELLQGLPFRFFATSSIDAFIHAIESYLSPKASKITETCSIEVMKTIIRGYKIIADCGENARYQLLDEFLMASTMAGIAFGNAGCAAVHALSYPLGGSYHVPHGEANYCVFTGVFSTYMQKEPEGKIKGLNDMLAKELNCSPSEVYDKLEELFNHLIPKKALHDYGVKAEELESWTDSVIEGQQRLLRNNYVPLSRDEIFNIYEKLY